jgi:hypothetical protein
MPWFQLIVPEHCLLIKRASGLVGDEDLGVGVRCLVRHLAGEQVRREICLVDPGCDFRITPAGLHRALADAQAIARDLGGAPQATVAANDLHFGVARMFASLMANFNLRTEVFRSLDEAFGWVNVPVQKIDLAAFERVEEP